MPDTLRFEEIRRPFTGLSLRPQAKAYTVLTARGAVVGHIRWNHGSRGYALYPVKGTAWDRLMLGELVDFLRSAQWTLRGRIASAGPGAA